jgi:hypothetical protein
MMIIICNFKCRLWFTIHSIESHLNLSDYHHPNLVKILSFMHRWQISYEVVIHYDFIWSLTWSEKNSSLSWRESSCEDWRLKCANKPLSRKHTNRAERERKNAAISRLISALMSFSCSFVQFQNIHINF